MLSVIKKFAFLFIFQFVATGLVFAQERGTANDAKALVEKGLAHIKAVGPQKAFEDFSAKDNEWHVKDLYLFANSSDGVTTAHGGNKGLIGKQMVDLKDANGKAFIREMVDTAKNKGSGWVDYMWTNPTTKKVEAKSSYVVKIPDYDGFLGVGIYK